jgi:hypothetical protein
MGDAAKSYGKGGYTAQEAIWRKDFCHMGNKLKIKIAATVRY